MSENNVISWSDIFDSSNEEINNEVSISDSLIFEIAKKKDTPVYIIAMNTGFNSDGLFSILKYNSKTLIWEEKLKLKKLRFIISI